ncbi:hypothetical protein P1P91_06440 [Halomonas piscis]|uniref:Uncharacterized protein n=1 Tax=Halomonas piscis TaxID=3031727 RepID=A0ABY9Z2P3_9GAMM|nr:hypothetical protein [Halomonas piscis]WNK21307.1 hypothetical protein P1P91_06440 [Halomonas piscis]
MPFQITKVSDQGTANPIVARLSVQTSQLVKFCPGGEELHKSVLELFHDYVQKQLLECDQISQEITREVLEIGTKLGKGGIKTQAAGRVVEILQVIRLNQRVEQFLYCAKSALRDLARIFALFFGKEFDSARYDRIIAWAEEEFGDESELVRILRQDHDLWIKKLVSMRNAVEHPGGYSGHLHIHNITFVSPSHPNYPTLETPSWHLNDEPKVPIVEYLQATVNNVLEFCEDMLAICITMSGLPEMIGFAEIPESERDPACPIRIRAVPKNIQT